MSGFMRHGVSYGATDFYKACKAKNIKPIIFKNNRPKYRLVDLEREADIALSEDEAIDVVAARILKRYKPAFMELAK